MNDTTKSTIPNLPIVAYISEQIQKFQESYSLPEGKSFMLWYGIEALGLGEDSAYEAASYDGGNDKAIDLFHCDEENERIVIAQGKYSSKGRYKPTVGEFLELVHTTDWLQNAEQFEREGRSDLAEAARIYGDARRRGFVTEFHYVYMGNALREVTEASAQFNNAHVGDVPAISSRIIHLDVLHHEHDEFINAKTRIGNATLRLDPSMAFQQRGTYGQALTATVPGNELQKLYAEHGDSLFDRNVRIFLGARAGTVNAGIRDTLASLERKNFWAYNNGITFICDRYEYSENNGELVLHNFSIVNGCQTTVSVARGPSPLPPEVAVMTRFIAVADDATVDSIIRFTNSQTPIRLWDIASQDSTQKRLKRELAEEPNPFFYELRRGETGHLKPEERRFFTRNNKFHVIKPDALAQYLGAFKGIPVDAYRYKAGLFTTHQETVFPSDLRVEEVILAWLAGDAAEEAVKDAIVDAVQREDAMRSRVLKRGAKLFVLAEMGIILAERNGAIYIAKLKRETASSRANRERLVPYARLSIEWYLEIMQDLLADGAELNLLLRNTETVSRIRSKILTRWKVQSMDRKWVDNALPKIG